MHVLSINTIFAYSKFSEKAQSQDKNIKVKPITGTWLNLAYKDVRNKYTNPLYFDNNDPELWKSKVHELYMMGIEYIVLMEVANEGKAYYPSSIMPLAYDNKRISPVEAILDEASKLGVRVFMSTGWARNQDDNLQDLFVKERQKDIMKELSILYKEKKSFYGWYLPVEDCLCPIFEDYAVSSVNSLVEKAHTLTPGKKTLISPYGIGLSDFDNPNYERQLSKLKVDIIAYQDEVGCVREKYPLPRLKMNWKRLRKIHDCLGIEMWANCETFTWEKDVNSRQSALIPTFFPRLLSQQVAASKGGVDRIISFMFSGIIENPESKFQLGEPIWSNRLYNDYIQWKKGNYYWKLTEKAMSCSLGNGIPQSALVINNNIKLIDKKVAEETPLDSNWVMFNKGYNEVIIDLHSKIEVKDIMIRYLNTNSEDIASAKKTYLYLSDDGKTFSLIGVNNSSNYPENKHDTWTDGVLFQKVRKNARYVKLAFYGDCKIGIDEVFVNPFIMK